MSDASTPATRTSTAVSTGGQDRDPGAIQSEMEVVRERLAGTIDLLLYRAHPKTIVKRAFDDVRARFVDDRGNPRTENIATTAAAVAGVIVVVVVIRRVVNR